MKGFGQECDAMRAWLREPRDYKALEANRVRIARTCTPFEEPPPRPQMPHSAARDANHVG